MKNYVPCICLNPACGISFQMPSPVIGGNVTMTSCGTNCPKCNGSAKIVDGSMTSSGHYKIGQLFDYISNIKDSSKLHQVKQVLESANDQEYAEELVKSLAEIDPNFLQFKSAIKRLPYEKIGKVVDKLLVLISIIIAYYAVVKGDEASKQNLELQQKQFELNQSQFEYQKDQDKSKSDLQQEIDQLRQSIESELNEQKTDEPRKNKKMKGCERNKPCPCGSGKKYKKCHPHGLMV